MPNLDPNQIRIAATGAFWKAPLGTAAPTDSMTAYSAAWTHLGYSSDAGFSIIQNLKGKTVPGWQSTEPLRYIIDSLDRRINVESLESDKQNLQLAWGAGTVTQTGTPVGGAVTFSAGTITSATPHSRVVGDAINFGTVTGTPGVTTGTTYFVLTVPTSTTMTVSATPGGTAVTITAGSATGITPAGPFSIAIPDTAVSSEFAIGIDWSDGTYSNRIIVPRATLFALPTVKFMRTDVVRYPLDLQVLKPADGSQSILPYGSDWAASS